MVAFPSIALASARKGISLWLSNVLPALLPFFICANFLQNIGIIRMFRSGALPVCHERTVRISYGSQDRGRSAGADGEISLTGGEAADELLQHVRAGIHGRCGRCGHAGVGDAWRYNRGRSLCQEHCSTGSAVHADCWDAKRMTPAGPLLSDSVTRSEEGCRSLSRMPYCCLSDRWGSCWHISSCSCS